MKREDIIKMARQVEAEGFAPVGVWPEVRRLCELVYAAGAAAEREACAKVCEELDIDGWRDAGWDMGTIDCAAAIRARGEAK